MIHLPPYTDHDTVAGIIRPLQALGSVVAVVDYEGRTVNPDGLARLKRLGVDTTRLPVASLVEHGGGVTDADGLAEAARIFESVLDEVVVIGGADEARHCADCGREIETRADVLCDGCHNERDGEQA